MYMFSFVRFCHIIFQSGCTNFYFTSHVWEFHFSTFSWGLNLNYDILKFRAWVFFFFVYPLVGTVSDTQKMPVAEWMKAWVLALCSNVLWSGWHIAQFWHLGSSYPSELLFPMLMTRSPSPPSPTACGLQTRPYFHILGEFHELTTVKAKCQ